LSVGRCVAGRKGQRRQSYRNCGKSLFHHRNNTMLGCEGIRTGFWG
jgi:hypothetical protein